MLKFRELNSNEIEVRIAQCGDGWAQLLLYKDARVDMSILDETVGPENWTREHYECKGNLFCRVGVNVNFDNPEKDEKWVFKSDCGSESNTEKEKGESSDSFKRACVNFGIGRELYTKIPIFVNVQTKTNPSGKGYILADKRERFSVKEIQINKEVNQIVYLEVVNKNREVVFKWRNPDVQMNNKIENQTPQIVDNDNLVIEVVEKEIKTETKEEVTPAPRQRVKRS